MRAVSIRGVSFAVIMLAALAGCGGGGAPANPTASLSAKANSLSWPSATSTSSTTSTPTASLTLFGSPPSTVTVGQAYGFTPSVSNSGGTVTFSIKNAPRWASFNSSTGKLSGTPQSANAGTYANIQISASNGQSSASLPAFSITVIESGAATGSADVSWTPPTTNTDGSTLTDLAGYTIYYGTSPGSLTQTVQITNVGLSNYVVSGLTSGTWYFAVTAYTSSGAQSGLSNVASKTI